MVHRVISTILCFSLAALVLASTNVKEEYSNSDKIIGSKDGDTEELKDVYSRKEAENTDYNFGTSVCSTADDVDGQVLCAVDIGDYVCYYLQDFTDNRQPVGITLRVSNGFNSTAYGLIYLYVKTLAAPPVATLNVMYTGGYDIFETISASISIPVYWTQDYCLSFSYSDANEVNDIEYKGMRVNWIEFY